MVILLEGLNMKTKWECRNKQRFISKEDAEEEIYIYKEESLGGITELRPYKCKYCKGWHLTSKIE